MTGKVGAPSDGKVPMASEIAARCEDARLAPDDEALVAGRLVGARRRCVDARTCERPRAFVCVLARYTSSSS
jgi:hypothetical protein